MKILVIQAIKEEHVDLPEGKHTWKQVYCGVGKVNAAIETMKAAFEFQPDVILNIGTSGALQHPVGSIHVCNRFIDRDMDVVKEFGVPYLETFDVDLNEMNLSEKLQGTATVNTGDTFLTDFNGEGDVFDMEAFAIARVCKRMELPFISVKYVTDIIGQNSIKAWEDKLADARVGLQAFVNDVFGE